MKKEELLDLLNSDLGSGRTSLMMACVNLNVELVRKLIAAGIDIDKKDLNGFSALALTIDVHFIRIDQRQKGTEQKRYEIVKMLIDAGADIKIDKQIFGNAIFYGLITIVVELISKGASVNQSLTVEGYSPLMIAILSGDTLMIEYLISNGAKINQKALKGETALILSVKTSWEHLCISRESKRSLTCEIVKSLLSANAKVNLCDKDGNDALIYASKTNHFAVIKELVAAGAHLNVKNKVGKDFYDLLTNEKIKSWVFMHFPKFAKEKQRNLDASKFGI